MGITYDLFKDRVSVKTFIDDSYKTLELKENLDSLQSERTKCEAWVKREKGCSSTKNIDILKREITVKLEKNKKKELKCFLVITAILYYLITFVTLLVAWPNESYIIGELFFFNAVSVILFLIGVLKDKESIFGFGIIGLIFFFIADFVLFPGFWAWFPVITSVVAIIVVIFGVNRIRNHNTYEYYAKTSAGMSAIEHAMEADNAENERLISEAKERLSVLPEEIKQAEEEYEGYKEIYEIWESQDKMIRLFNIPLLSDTIETIKQMIGQLPYKDGMVIPIEAAECAMEMLKVSKKEAQQTIDDIMRLWNDLTK